VAEPNLNNDHYENLESLPCILDGVVDPFSVRELWVSAAQKEAPAQGFGCSEPERCNSIDPG
jgi:hypothetical protein